MRLTVRRLLVATLAILALSGVAGNAAQAATEGPYHKVAGSRLLSGKTKEVTAKSNVNFVMRDATYRVRIECTSLKLKAGATIAGSTGANAATGKEVIEYSGCKGGASGESLNECEPEGEKITTVPLVSTLGYSREARTGLVYELFKPETGSTFVHELKFEGSNCVWLKASFVGSMIGELRAGGKPVEVGKNEVEAAASNVSFGTLSTIWTEAAGKLTSTKAHLEAFGSALALQDEAAFELAGKENWGVFA